MTRPTQHGKPQHFVAGLSKSDLEAIARTHQRWIEEEIANNSGATLQLCTNDVVWMPPDSPSLVGKENIERWLSSAQVEIRNIQITNLKIDGDGSVAYLTANYLTSYTSEPDALTSKGQGAHLWILRKMSSGDWKVAIVMWSSFGA